MAGAEGQEAGVDEGAAAAAGVEAAAGGVDSGAAAGAAHEPNRTGWGWMKSPPSPPNSVFKHRGSSTAVIYVECHLSTGALP